MSAAERYADPAFELATTSDVIALMLAHRSVRRYTERQVSDEELVALVAAAQSAPTSSNIQAWSVVAVRDRERLARLAELSGNAFVADAPLFLVWVADLDRHHRLAARAGVTLEAPDHLETTLLAFVDSGIAAQNLVTAAESLRLGTVFVGGIRNRPLEVAEELGLPPHTVATFGLAVGEPDPTEPAGVKPRLPQQAVLHHERYDAAAADALIPDYDKRLEGYHRRFGLGGTWSGRVLARLAGPSSMNGRHLMRQLLERRGLPSR
jgi:nitroreductase